MRCERCGLLCRLAKAGGRVRRALCCALVLYPLACSSGDLWAEDRVDTGTAADSTRATPQYELAPIRVTADRLSPEQKLRDLPGQTSWLDVQPFQLEITNTANVLDQLPGLHIQNYGSIGHVATASIRGTSASQITVYLDGVPLTRAGAGLMNLAELPFAGVHHIEVYRGFAPSSLPGSSMGGAINLVSDVRMTGGLHRTKRLQQESTVRFGAGSLDTRRFGFSHRLVGRDWDVLVVADALQSDGDFEFLDDNGTDWNTADDGIEVRQNNWLRSQELLVKVSAPLRSTRLTFSNQWIDRKEGLAGRYEDQAEQARLGLAHNLTNLHLQLPAVAHDRLMSSLRFYYDWRRDSFLDPKGEISLGRHDNRDKTQDFGTQIFLESRLPVLQFVTALGHLRQETYDPVRPSRPQTEVQQSRSVAELALGERWSSPGKHLALQGTLRLFQEDDHFTGDLLASNSSASAASSNRRFVEPHVGLRLRLLRGLHAEASYGEYHRSPSFMELFGEKGSVAGNPRLVPEEGINRDAGLEWSAAAAGVRWHLEAAHFRNRVDHLIVFVPQNQRVFIARNIGSARMQGEEVSWSFGMQSSPVRWNLQGNVTRQRTRDLGVDTTVYADKVLPGRPETQAFARLAVGWSRYDVAWQVEHLGLNYLDRFNLYDVPERTRQGIDASVRLGNLRVKAAVRNLTDNRDVDALQYPLPGRAYSLMTEVRF